MANRLYAFRMAGVPLTLLCICGTAKSQSALTHPGKVLEMDSRKPISVSVKAWPDSKESGKDGNCPLYGSSPLDSTISTNSGDFKLTIKKDKPTYTVVYCHSAYVPRTDRDLPNGSKNGEPVIPMPTFLYPTNAKTALGTAVKRRIIGVLNDLSYIRKVNGDQFATAISELQKDISTTSTRRGNIVATFNRLVRDWGE